MQEPACLVVQVLQLPLAIQLEVAAVACSVQQLLQAMVDCSEVGPVQVVLQEDYLAAAVVVQLACSGAVVAAWMAAYHSAAQLVLQLLRQVAPIYSEGQVSLELQHHPQMQHQWVACLGLLALEAVEQQQQEAYLVQRLHLAQRQMQADCLAWLVQQVPEAACLERSPVQELCSVHSLQQAQEVVCLGLLEQEAAERQQEAYLAQRLQLVERQMQVECSAWLVLLPPQEPCLERSLLRAPQEQCLVRHPVRTLQGPCLEHSQVPQCQEVAFLAHRVNQEQQELCSVHSLEQAQEVLDLALELVLVEWPLEQLQVTHRAWLEQLLESCRKVVLTH